MTPRGVRNRNPGNIIQSGIPWEGKVANPTDSRFEQFDTDEHGIRALAKLLISYEDSHGLNTIRGIINRWAPPVENDTGAYVNAVAARCGVGPDTVISTHSPGMLYLLTVAIIAHENAGYAYPESMVQGAVNAALGLVYSPRDVAPPTRPTKGIQEAHLGATLLASLLPTILGMFSGKAQQAIQKATGADPAVAAQFTQELFTKVGAAVGIPVTDDASAIKAVAAAQALPEQEIKALGDSALGLLVEAGGGGVGGAREFIQQNANNPEMVKILRVVSYWALLFLSWANVAGFILCGFLVYRDKTEWQQIVSTLIQADIAAAMIALGFWLGATLAKSNATTPNLR